MTFFLHDFLFGNGSNGCYHHQLGARNKDNAWPAIRPMGSPNAYPRPVYLRLLFFIGSVLPAAGAVRTTNS